MDIDSLVDETFGRLRKYVEANDFKGWDPYDGLNSVVFQQSPLRHWHYARLAWIQFFKRSPVNFRRIMGVKKAHNSKGLGLFLSGYVHLYRMEPKAEYEVRMRELVEKLRQMTSPGYSGACWGYNFDWQARAFFQPKGTPTVVATTYVAYALLDYYELTRDESILKIARSSCDFILNDLCRTYDDSDNFCFSYSPLDKTAVFNASLLGSRLLARVFSFTREEHLREAASKSVAFCCSRQQPNGAWSYGTLPFHSWIDNFHTGFNLECIAEYARHCNDHRFSSVISKGLSFYLNTFFTEKGESRYYDRQLYPIDIHAPAQLIVTLYRLRLLNERRELAERVVKWTIQNMFDKRGFFYYQLKPGFSSRIPYMRWAQAWMFFCLSLYKSSIHEK